MGTVVSRWLRLYYQTVDCLTREHEGQEVLTGNKTYDVNKSIQYSEKPFPPSTLSLARKRKKISFLDLVLE